MAASPWTFRINSLHGDFSGMHLVSLMYAAFQRVATGTDVSIDLSREYAQAVALFDARWRRGDQIATDSDFQPLHQLIHLATESTATCRHREIRGHHGNVSPDLESDEMGVGHSGR